MYLVFLQAHSYSWDVYEDGSAVKSTQDVMLVSFTVYLQISMCN